jgi:hypothetical protein
MDSTPKVSVPLGCVNLVLALACINVLGWLTLRRLPVTSLTAFVLAFGLVVVALIGLAVLSVVLHLLNPEVARAHGKPAAFVAVASGMVMVIPFAVLALIAELVLHWSAAQAFATAGVMTGAAGIGVEISRLGPGRKANALVPALAGGLFVVVWILFGTLLQEGSK